MNKVEKIRAEIERRIAYHEEWFDPGSDGKDALLEENKEILSFIDSLQDQCNGCNNVKGCVTCKDGSEWAHYEEPISKDLEEAANAYIHNESNWIHPRTETFKAGAEWQKQQMMKDAVEGLVICDELTHFYKDIVFAIPDVLKVGDKVKLIIIKEE